MLKYYDSNKYNSNNNYIIPWYIILYNKITNYMFQYNENDNDNNRWFGKLTF